METKRGHRDSRQGDCLNLRQREDTGHRTGRLPHLKTKGGHRTQDREIASPEDKARTHGQLLSVKCEQRKYVGTELIRGGL